MGLFRRLFGAAPAPQPRLRDVLERMDAIEGDVAGFRKRLNQLTGMVTGAMRAKEQAQEPAGPTNDPQLDIQYQPMPNPPTGHLSRRFRVGG